MSSKPSLFDRDVSRREVLQILGVAAAGGALLEACSVGTSKVAGTKEYHGAWPYQVPPTGHFNIVNGVVKGILSDGPYIDLVVPPMAMYYWKEQKWLPLLAKDAGTFDKSANTFTIKLQSGLKWSDGKTLTSKDVVTTFWALRLIRNVVWKYIDKIQAPDDTTVVFHMSTPSTVVQRYVLKAEIYSDSTYGDWAQKAQALFSSGKDLSSDEGKKLNDDFQKFQPDKVIASGPFNYDYKSVTNNAQLALVRNSGGLMADKVQFDKVVLYNGETNDVTPVVLSKNVDYATHGFPPATEKQFTSEGIRILRPPVYSGPALLFNLDKLKEFADKRARQAIAYAINRDDNGTVALADSGKGVKFMAGFSDNLVPDWISSADQAKLNRYEYNQQKAGDLLQQAGWKKSGSAWQTPDGKNAEYEIAYPAEFADWSASATNAADQLTKFGIKVTPRSVTFTQEPIDVDKGNFQLAIQAWGASTQPHPTFSFIQDLFTHNIPTAANQGGRGMGFELKQGGLDLEQIVVNSGLGLDEAAQKDNVTKAALAFNDLLPMVPLFERYGNNPALSGKRVTGWPAEGDPLLQNAPYGDNFTVMLIYLGRLKPV